MRFSSLKPVPVCAAVVLALAASPASADPQIVKQGIRGDLIQIHFDDFARNGYTPVYARVAVVGGQMYGDFVWEPNNGTRFELRHQLTTAEFNQKDKDLRSLGWVRVSANPYDLNGQRYHCGLWHKPR